MLMLGFFTSTAMQRLFAMQITMPGTAKVITNYVMSIKPNMPEVKIPYLFLVEHIKACAMLKHTAFNNL